jgi:hypothetical protein
MDFEVRLQAAPATEAKLTMRTNDPANSQTAHPPVARLRKGWLGA